MMASDFLCRLNKKNHACPPPGHRIHTHPSSTSPSLHRKAKQADEEMCFSFSLPRAGTAQTRLGVSWRGGGGGRKEKINSLHRPINKKSNGAVACLGSGRVPLKSLPLPKKTHTHKPSTLDARRAAKAKTWCVKPPNVVEISAASLLSKVPSASCLTVGACCSGSQLLPLSFPPRLLTSLYLQLSDISARTGRAAPSAALFIPKS